MITCLCSEVLETQILDSASHQPDERIDAAGIYSALRTQGWWLETVAFVPLGCCSHGHFVCIHPHGSQKVKAPGFCLWFRFHVHQYGGPSSRSWHSPYEFPKDHMCIKGKHKTGWLSLVAQACPCSRPFIPFWRLFPYSEHTGHLEALVVRSPSLSSRMLSGKVSVCSITDGP